jgi:PRTRC genetic system ThiF family protein
MENKEAIHYTHPYLIDPQHPVTVNVIGCGGTGSQVLNTLARMDSALRSLEHPGLHVRAIDPDLVTEANKGRQLFSDADIDSAKSVVLISRINRFFGLRWEAYPELFNERFKHKTANITISCVDSGPARKMIKQTVVAVIREENMLKKAYNYHRGRCEPYQMAYYWMDYGNMKDRGQVVIGTFQSVEQPKDSEFACRGILPTVDKLHPSIFNIGKMNEQGPSCSLAEALGRQDLLINTNLANMGMDLLWKMFREAKIRYHGLYLNLETMSMNPIPIR